MFVCCTLMILYRVHTMPADDSILRYIGHNGFLMSQTEQASGIAARIDTHRTHIIETVCESQKFTGIMTCGLLWLKVHTGQGHARAYVRGQDRTCYCQLRRIYSMRFVLACRHTPVSWLTNRSWNQYRTLINIACHANWRWSELSPPANIQK